MTALYHVLARLQYITSLQIRCPQHTDNVATRLTQLLYTPALAPCVWHQHLDRRTQDVMLRCEARCTSLNYQVTVSFTLINTTTPCPHTAMINLHRC